MENYCPYRNLIGSRRFCSVAREIELSRTFLTGKFECCWIYGTLNPCCVIVEFGSNEPFDCQKGSFELEKINTFRT